MYITKIPKVNYRPKYLAKVYASNTNAPIPLIRSTGSNQKDTDLYSQISSYLANLKGPIGVIQKVSISSSRNNAIYREINFESLGRIKEVCPGLVEYSGSVSKMALYNEHLLDAFAAAKSDVYNNDTTENSLLAGFNIYNQIAPLILKIDLLDNIQYPSDNVTSIILWDCWFKQSEIEFDITSTDDLAVVQESEIKFAWLITN